MSAKWNLFVDVEKCSGCRNCFIAVKDEYVGNAEPGYFAAQPLADATWFAVEHHETGRVPYTRVSYLPKTCRHCDDAPCAKVATGGAVVKRPDGIVVFDPAKAIGQTAIAEACPFGAALWNDDLRIPQAWPFDAHLLDAGWKRTRVEQACPTGALKSEKLTDVARDAKLAAENWRVLPGEEAVRPRVFYRGLDRIEEGFVAGSVFGDVEGRSECLEGARVRVVLENGTTLATETDTFGDFRLATPLDVGTVELAVEHPGFETLHTRVRPSLDDLSRLTLSVRVE